MRASNGLIYGIPESSSTILVINPATDAVHTFGDVSKICNASACWLRGTISPETGAIYGIPFRAYSILKIDPVTNSISAVGERQLNTIRSSGFGWNGGVYSPVSKRIYGIPLDAAQVLVIDPATDRVSFLPGGTGVQAGGTKWYGGVLGSDNKIYGIPQNSPSVVVFL